MPDSAGQLTLPPCVADRNLGAFLRSLVAVRPDEHDAITIDFSAARFMAPGATVSLLAAVQSWNDGGVTVYFAGVDCCSCKDYLQRMDFFALSGIKLTESFKRRSSAGRFMELKRIDANAGTVEDISTAVARCMFPELADSSDPDEATPYDLVQYAASELISNVRQHARGAGFISAQRYEKAKVVRVAIADCGIGIRRSFEENTPPFWHPSMTHLDSIRTALIPQASSKSHLSSAWGAPINAGVGLSILQEIATSGLGRFSLGSGNAFLQANGALVANRVSETEFACEFSGTLCALEIPLSTRLSMSQRLHDAKVKLGLLKTNTDFDSFFLS